MKTTGAPTRFPVQLLQQTVFEDIHTCLMVEQINKSPALWKYIINSQAVARKDTAAVAAPSAAHQPSSGLMMADCALERRIEDWGQAEDGGLDGVETGGHESPQNRSRLCIACSKEKKSNKGKIECQLKLL